VENVLRRMGVNVERCAFEPLTNELFSDGLIIRAVNKKVLGFIGIVDRKLRKQFDIDNDVYYADHISFWLDVKIFFKTVQSVLMHENVYVAASNAQNTHVEEKK
ncbi:MAG: sugar transferase, partial [Thermoguttaceae bacterium]|nr:sugar transferase [Thermoguttaceae bacterium]